MYFNEPMPDRVPEHYRERQEAREHEEALRTRTARSMARKYPTRRTATSNTANCPTGTSYAMR